jgi:uncharacterized protein
MMAFPFPYIISSPRTAPVPVNGYHDFTTTALRFIIANFLWVTSIGILMFLTKNTIETGAGLLIVAFLYMPAPMVFTLLFERFRWRTIVRTYGLSFRRWQIKKSVPWAITFYAIFTLLYLTATIVLGNWLKLPGMGHLILDRQEFLKIAQATSLPLTNNLNLLYFITFLNSILVGLTLNALFAFGEELGWRGYLWQQMGQFESLSDVQRKCILGTVWGLWHTPLILQGYNFPGQPIAGIGYMLVSCIALTFILTDFTDRYNTVIVAALIHGMINATQYLSVIVADAKAPIGTILGVVSAATMVAAWKITSQGRDRYVN